MRRAVVFYFSGTGNTWWVANELANSLRERQIEATTYSIEQITVSQAQELTAASGVVGFGYPIYGSDLPLPMQRFISELEVSTPKHAFVFCTQWLWSGDGASVGAKMLRAQGFQVRWGEHFHMPSNVSVPIFPWPLHTDSSAAKAKYLKHSSFRQKRLAQRIARDKPLYRGFNRLSYLAGLVQRAPFRRYLHKFQNDFTPDPHLCTLCAQCVSLCPTGNFVGEDAKVHTLGRCVLCLRCYSFCPEQAMLYRGRPHRHGIPYRGPIPGFDPFALVGPNKRF